MLGDQLCRYGSQAIPVISCHDQMHLWFLLSLAWNHSSLSSWQHCPLPCSSSLHPDHFLLKLPFELHFTGRRKSVYTTPRSTVWSCNRTVLGWGRFWMVVPLAAPWSGLQTKDGRVARIWTVLGPDKLSPEVFLEIWWLLTEYHASTITASYKIVSLAWKIHCALPVEFSSCRWISLKNQGSFYFIYSFPFSCMS